eukprot:TRINITY_DN2957_c0_g1_i2.p1 TRINITY_DN2957_c0_g1~~TRINITY_DN2957_c0_g1_i2.p1  ORF type:complete len:224 (-),score=40.44 TRINITY_DN2957_c0_g1_i2:282-953(-)
MLMEKGDALHLPGGGDGITHLLTKLREYFKPDFVPTKEDIIRVRVKTTGIIETTFELKGVQFIVCDVGGQRSERRQWIKCFSNVDAVIYLVATNEYDIQLEESAQDDAIFDSLHQWKTISSMEMFQETTFILFLNKIDLFKEKIKRVPLSLIYGDYINFSEQHEGLAEDERGIAYFEKAYRRCCGSKRLYVFPTCVLDQELCNKIFFSIRDVVFQAALDATGL